jgi:hypothetical protein
LPENPALSAQATLDDSDREGLEIGLTYGERRLGHGGGGPFSRPVILSAADLER